MPGRPNRGLLGAGVSSGGLTSFEAGHELSTRHGAWSPRRVEPLTAEIAQAALDGVAWLSEPTFGPAVWAWARAEARCQLLAEYLADQGPLEDDGRPRPALEAAARQERIAAEARGRLGLDPTSRARLERELADAGLGLAKLEDALAHGADLRRAAERREPPADPEVQDAAASAVDPAGGRGQLSEVEL